MKVATRLGSAVLIAAALLVSNAATAAASSANPTDVAFGSVPLNTTASATVAVTVDAGYQVLGAGGVSALNPPYAFDFDTCGAGGAFAGPGTCNVKETFTPTAVGPTTADLVVTLCPTAGGTCQNVGVHFTGTGVSLAGASPASWDFGNVALNTSAAKSIAITVDTGYRVLGAGGVSALNPPYAFDFDTCGAGGAFAGPGTCNVKETFTPTAVGPTTADLLVTLCPTAGGTCFNVPVHFTGTGVSLAGASPASWDFGNVALNTTVSKSIAITVDTGYRVLGAGGVSALNPPYAFDFDTCGAGGAFAGPGTCNVKESFTPAAVGPTTADLLVTLCPTVGGTCINVPVHFTGSGISVAAANPASVAFGDVVLNSSVTKNVALTIDAGYKVLGAGGVSALNPPYAFDFDTCGAGGAFTGPGTCNVKETFTPTATGPTTADLLVTECPVGGGTCINIPVHFTGNGVTALAIATTTLPGGTYGTPYPTTTLTATGGTPPYSWAITSGALPDGLTLNSATGTLSGTPTSAGTFTFTVTATDSGSPHQTASKSYTVTIIGSSDVALSIATATKPLAQSKDATFTLTVHDFGPTSATGVSLTTAVPTGSLLVSATPSQGTCTTPPVGSTGTIICSLGTIANGADATLTLTVDPNGKKVTLTDNATVATSSSDPVPANNSATASIQIK